jgi:hypothetical protein
MKQARTHSSVQRDMVYLRETKGDMLCLYAPASPTKRSYRAVLEVSPINFSLKAEEEQEAIIERFAALIRSLSFPLQILVRNQRLDLAPYIGRLLTQPNGQVQHPSAWLALARSLADLLAEDRLPAHAHRTARVCHHPSRTSYWHNPKTPRVPVTFRQASSAACG